MVGSASSVKILEDVDMEQHLLAVQFQAWAETYGRRYSSTVEAKKRFAIWVENHGMLV
jgi:hypothetical protein